MTASATVLQLKTISDQSWQKNYDCLKPYWNTYGVQYSMEISIWIYRTGKPVINKYFQNYNFHLIISDLLHVLLANHCQWLCTFLRKTDVEPLSAALVPFFNCWSVLIDVCTWTSLLHCVILLNTVTLASGKVLGDVFRRLHIIFSGCIAALVYDVASAISLTNMTHKAINSVFSPRLSALGACWLSSICDGFVVSFIDMMVWCVFVVVLCLPLMTPV